MSELVIIFSRENLRKRRWTGVGGRLVMGLVGVVGVVVLMVRDGLSVDWDLTRRTRWVGVERGR